MMIFYSFDSKTASVPRRLAPILAMTTTIFLLNLSDQFLIVGAMKRVNNFFTMGLDHLNQGTTKWGGPRHSSPHSTSSSLFSSLLAKDPSGTGQGIKSEDDYRMEVEEYQSRSNKFKRFIGRLFKLKLSTSEDDPFRFERATSGGDDVEEDSWMTVWDEQFRKIAPDLLKIIQDDHHHSVGSGGIDPSRGLESIDHPHRVKIEEKDMIKLRWNLFMINFLEDLRKSGMINQNIVSDFDDQLTNVRWIANALSKGLKPNHSPISFLLNLDLRRAILNEAGSQEKREFLERKPTRGERELLDQETWELIDFIHLEKQLLEFSLVNVDKISQTMLMIDCAHVANPWNRKNELSPDRSSTSWNGGMPLFKDLLQVALSHIFRFSEDLVENEIHFGNRLKALIGLKLQYRILRSMYHHWGELGPKDYLETRLQRLFLYQLGLLEAALSLVSTILHSACLRYLARLHHQDRSGGMNPIYLSESLDRLIQLMNSMDDYRSNKSHQHNVFNDHPSLSSTHDQPPSFPDFVEKIKTGLEGLSAEDTEAIDRANRAAIVFNETTEEAKARIWELFGGKKHDSLIWTAESMKIWALSILKLVEDGGHDELLERLLLQRLD